MIPLKDLTPHRSKPWMTFALIFVNCVIFLYENSLMLQSPYAFKLFIQHYAMIPARLQLALASSRVSLTDALSPMFTSMFLHGGWLHLIGNMWFLWIFGDVVEDRMGRLRYLGFYLICGLGAAITQTIVNWGSTVPTLGASGAIAGVMGAYIVWFPRSQVLTLVPLLFFWFTIRLPAVLMVGYWFVIQFLSGLASLAMPETGGVAFWAHVGGFLLGALLTTRMRPRTPAYYYG
jgi:membrane associated rhomboid family serine protease